MIWALAIRNELFFPAKMTGDYFPRWSIAVFTFRGGLNQMFGQENEVEVSDVLLMLSSPL